ncbi:MAG: WG repeat-containing protein, partial [Erysipelotrichales bacterium]|nr:WG repeat-containing protein [Erysipelotrichales bacterium]
TYDGALEAISITAQGKDVPTISLCQDALGNWIYQYHLYYTYHFEYTKNGTTRKANMELVSFFGNGEGLWGLYNQNSKNEIIYLQANNQTFTIRIKDGKTYNANNKEIIFTTDLEQKILKYYQEYEDKAMFIDTGLINKLTTTIEKYGDKVEYQPFQLGETIDSEWLKDNSNRIQDIQPLLYLHNNTTPTYYTETGLYLLKSHYSYGILDKNHKVVMPCISTLPMYVVDGSTGKELANFDSFLTIEEINKLNHSEIPIGKELYLNTNSYLYDGNDLYIQRVNEDSEIVTKLEKPYSFSFDSIPVTLINYVVPITVNGSQPYNSYTYSIEGYSLMDSNGELLTKFRYSEIKPTINDYMPVRRDILSWGMLDSKGKQVLPLTYHSISFAHGKYAIVEENFQYGVIDLETREMKYGFVGASNMIFWDKNTVLVRGYNGEYSIISFVK